MPKITKVYTRKGDDGSTALGGGQRVQKYSHRIEAYGTVDELNSFIGQAINKSTVAIIQQCLREIQNDLFHLGCDLCILEEDKETMKVPGVEERHVQKLEKWMDEMSQELAPLQNFILPGGSEGASLLHICRTICRRAERCLVYLGKEEAIGKHTTPYLNRLSDYLFVASRFENYKNGVDEPYWDSRA